MIFLLINDCKEILFPLGINGLIQLDNLVIIFIYKATAEEIENLSATNIYAFNEKGKKVWKIENFFQPSNRTVSYDDISLRKKGDVVTETQEGVRVISSSEKRLRPVQRKLLGQNEVKGVGLGHAEVTGINHARGAGLNPTDTAASRPICLDCQGFLKDQNVRLLSPLKK